MDNADEKAHNHKLSSTPKQNPDNNGVVPYDLCHNHWKANHQTTKSLNLQLIVHSPIQSPNINKTPPSTKSKSHKSAFASPPIKPNPLANPNTLKRILKFHEPLTESNDVISNHKAQ